MHINRQDKAKKTSGKEDQEDIKKSSIRESRFNPIVEVVGESSKSQLKFKKPSIRESIDTNNLSNNIDSDTVKYKDHRKDKAETLQVVQAEQDHQEYQTDEDEEEKVHMQPYSYRSKITEKVTKKSNKTNKKNKVVDRLYTIKTSNMFNKTQPLKDDIKVEDHTPNSKYNTFLDNTLAGFNSYPNINLNKTVTCNHVPILSPLRMKIGLHRHSNSDTILKTRSFKSNHNSQKFSKQEKKILTPENPSLIIFKKPIENMVANSKSNK